MRRAEIIALHLVVVIYVDFGFIGHTAPQLAFPDGSEYMFECCFGIVIVFCVQHDFGGTNHWFMC